MGRQPSYDDLRSRCDALEAQVDSQGREIDRLKDDIKHLEAFADTTNDTVRTLAAITATLGATIASHADAPELALKLMADVERLERKADDNDGKDRDDKPRSVPNDFTSDLKQPMLSAKHLLPKESREECMKLLAKLEGSK